MSTILENFVGKVHAMLNVLESSLRGTLIMTKDDEELAQSIFDLSSSPDMSSAACLLNDEELKTKYQQLAVIIFMNLSIEETLCHDITITIGEATQ